MDHGNPGTIGTGIGRGYVFFLFVVGFVHTNILAQAENKKKGMSLMQTFSNGKHVFSVDMMHAYINLFKPKVVLIPLTLLEYVIDHPGWGEPGSTYTARDVLKHPKKYKEDMERIESANLKYPIIIWKNQKGHRVVDGVHRIVKAQRDGVSKIRAVVFDGALMRKFVIGSWPIPGVMSQADIMQKFWKRFPPPTE